MTNTSNLAVQTMAKTQPPAAKAKAPASTKQPEKTFQQVMQETTQQTRQSQQPQTPAQGTTTTNATDHATQNTKTTEPTNAVAEEQNTMPEQDVSDVNKPQLVNGIEISKAFTDVKVNFLSMLFGESALEGVDMEQSDIEIMKDVYKNLTDPAEQFAMMMMMAFMQDNPEVSMADFAGTLDKAAWSNPDVSPVQKVFTAIVKMQQQNETLKSSDLLDTLMQLAREMKTPASVSKLSGELPNFKELEAMLMPQTTEKQQSNLQNTARTAGQDPAVLLQQGQAQFKGAVAQARQMMQSATTPDTPAAESQKAALTGGTGQKRESGVAIDVEKLQAQVDANSYMQNTSHQIYQLRQAGAVVVDQPEIDPMELINQVRTGILSGVQKGDNEFVLKLRPEGLGELTIHLVETGAKMTLSIVASNAQTQKLLTGELTNLQAAMKPLNVEVQPITTSEQASSSSMEHSLSEQMAQQQFGEHNHGEHFDAPTRFFHQLDDETSEQPLQAAGYAGSVGTSALDTYI